MRARVTVVAYAAIDRWYGSCKQISELFHSFVGFIGESKRCESEFSWDGQVLFEF